MNTTSYRGAAIKFAVGFLAIASLVVSLGIAAFVPESAKAATTDWRKSVSIVSRWSGDFGTDSFKQSVRDARDQLGVTSIALVIPYMQDNYQSSNVYSTGNTPSNETLGAAIDYIQSLGMKVTLKPHLETGNSGWRALIEASDRDAWYASYGAMLNSLADLAQARGAEEIVIGTELIGMASPYVHPDNTARWETLIDDVRARYSGTLTYSANWGRGINHTNEFEQIEFWDKLDYVGVSAYFDLSPDSGSVQSIMDAWATIDRDQIQPLHNRVGKPIVFTEVGYRSIENARRYPWDYNAGGNYDPNEQANLYEALIRYWNDRSYMNGIVIWDWHSDPNYGGQGNTDYTPHWKPAADTIKRWFGNGSQNPTEPNPNPDPNPQPSTADGTWGATSETVRGARVNAQVNVPLTVTITGQATNVITDVEIYNSSGTRVLQRFFEGQNVSQSTPQSYTIPWTPTASGVYVVKLGAFKSDWSQNYYWNDRVTSIAVARDSQTPAPTPTTTPVTTFETDIWWPSNGATVAGTQPFKAMLRDKPVEEYVMTWSVEGGPQNNDMPSNYADYPHKETSVDLSGWNWNSNNQYVVTFTSKDLAGNVISQKSATISIWK